MNLIVYTGAAQRNEAFMLSSLRENFISPINGSPSVGEIEDSIIGLYNLTKSGVLVDHYHLMILLGGVKQLPDTSKWGFAANNTKYYTGREIVSMILTQTPISMVRKPQSYDPSLAPYIDYHPEDIKVVIDDGVLKSGVLDKKSVARGQNGGIFHLIALEYGFEAAINAIYNLQQIAIAYNMMTGVTIGMEDIVVDKETKRKIDRIANDIVSRSQLVTDKLISGELIPPIGQTVSNFYEMQQISLLSVYDDFKDPVLRAKCMNANINGLFKMALCGSKGELENIYNMVSSIGQKVINGERMLEKFGYKRTLAYYRRFETDPEARGYIPDSYVSGTGTGAFVSGAMNARFDLVVKALNTSVTGEQNRNSIKNMEGSIVDNFRRVTKSQNIQQFVYGEDGLNPSRLEPVKLASIMLDTATLEAKYRYDGEGSNDPVFTREFDAIVSERNEYRRMFLQLEKINVRNLFTDEVKLPVNIERVIDRVKRAFRGQPAMTAGELKQASEYIWNYLEDLHYVLINEYQRSIRGKVPDMIKSATWLLKVYIRPLVSAKQISTLPAKAIEAICERITLRYTNALMAPGSAAGILAAQSFSAPLTQYMLDAHRRSATGGTSKSSMRTAKEVLGAKPVDKLEAPSMIVPLEPKYSADQNLAQEIANGIENMALRYFVTSWQVFFEKYGEPKHPKYATEAAMIAEFNKFNPLLKPPSDLVRWCIRLQLNRVNMILKSMSVEVIVRKLRSVYPDIYVVYSPENAPNPIIRIYMRNVVFGDHVNIESVGNIRETIMDTTIRGVIGVISAHTNERTKIFRNTVDEASGSIKRLEHHAIITHGTNLYGMMCVDQVDAYQVQTDAVMEIYEMFGVEAARHKIMIELRGLVDGISHRHYMSYADEMTYNGHVTSVERQGLSHREPNSIMLRIGFAAPIGTLEQAAVHNLSDNISGITAPLLIGSVPKIGTLYNRMYVSDKFVKANLKSADDILDAL